MTDYRKKLKHAWSVLKKAYEDGTFVPRKEADIQCFLYHCLIDEGLQPQKIHVEYRKKKKRCDIMLGDEKLYIEIKLSRLRNKTKPSKRWIRDVDKLKKEWGGNRKPTFALFIIKEKKKYPKACLNNSRKRIKRLNRYAQKKGVTVLSYP